MTTENQYYYKLMANYLSKRNCDDSLMRYLFGENATRKTAEELERADERKRRLQRERSRRYRALKNARRQHVTGTKEWDKAGDNSSSEQHNQRPTLEHDSLSEGEDPPTLLRFTEELSGSASDENSAQSALEAEVRRPPPSLRDLLAAPNAELDYPTVHSLMFHWLQT